MERLILSTSFTSKSSLFTCFRYVTLRVYNEEYNREEIVEDISMLNIQYVTVGYLIRIVMRKMRMGINEIEDSYFSTYIPNTFIKFAPCE